MQLLLINSFTKDPG